jgi:hypothetical protein
MHKVHKFDEFLKHKVLESIVSMRESIQTEIEEVSQKLDPKELVNDTPEELAGMLSNLLDAGGDLDKADLDDVKEHLSRIQENVEAEAINESESGLVYVLEVVGTIMGNADLIHYIGEILSKKLGKKVDVSKVSSYLKKFVDFVKTASGFPAKVIKKFFAWIAKMLGLNKSGTKIMGLVGLGVCTVILLIVGIMYFPAAAALTGASGIFTMLLSITSIIGKITEVTVIIQEIVNVVGDELVNRVTGKDPSEDEILDVLDNVNM